MNVVADTSVIIAVVANAPEKEALIKLTTGTDLIALLRFTGRLGMPSRRC